MEALRIQRLACFKFIPFLRICSGIMQLGANIYEKKESKIIFIRRYENVQCQITIDNNYTWIVQIETRLIFPTQLQFRSCNVLVLKSCITEFNLNWLQKQVCSTLNCCLKSVCTSEMKRVANMLCMHKSTVFNS